MATFPAPPNPPATRVPPERWVHETTDDERYVERRTVINRLDRWAERADVRVITVTGMGGQGKTSLIGHWLRRRAGAATRRVAGVFFWSFYADRSVGRFLSTLLDFGTQIGVLPADAARATPVEHAKEFLSCARCTVFLDGLEVVQAKADTARAGEILDNDLSELIDAACRSGSGGGLWLLTSRIPFTDLLRHVGSGLERMDLDDHPLSEEEGSQVLALCGVSGTEQERRQESRRFEGHPLALRIFAAALATQPHGNPARLDRALFAPGKFEHGLCFWRFFFRRRGARRDATLTRKIEHLLTFYERQIPVPRARILGVVALFRTPIEERTVFQLIRELRIAPDCAPEEEVRALCKDHLVTKQRGSSGGNEYVCHPILREYFRSVFLRRNSAMSDALAEALLHRPGETPQRNAWDVHRVAVAIEILLKNGQFVKADELYRNRLGDGRVFQMLPAYEDGLHCALSFVSGDQRKACERALPRRRFSFYLNSAGLFALNTGQIANASMYFRESRSIDAGARDASNLAIVQQNISAALRARGCLDDGLQASLKAVQLARSIGDWAQTMHALVDQADSLALLGRGKEAVAAFDAAFRIALQFSASGGAVATPPVPNEDATRAFATAAHRALLPEDAFCGINGVLWAEFLLRFGRDARARRATLANLRVCRNRSWRDDAALCCGLLGRLDTSAGAFDQARRYLEEAESIMRGGHMTLDLPGVLLAWAELYRRENALDSALKYADEALQVAAPRDIRLAQTDALILRGRILLDQAREYDDVDTKRAIERANSDAENGISLARQCRYVWAELLGLLLLAEIAEELGDRHRAKSLLDDAHVLRDGIGLVVFEIPDSA